MKFSTSAAIFLLGAALETNTATAAGSLRAAHQDNNRSLQESSSFYQVFNGYCRLDENGKNQGKEGRDYYKFKDVEDYDQCRLECNRRDDCRAFEWTEKSKRCEVWIGFPYGFKSGEGAKCYKKPVPVFDEVPVDWPYRSGFCRVDLDGNDRGEEGVHYVKFEGSRYDYDWCYEECDHRSYCVAFEWHDNICELWKEIPRGYDRHSEAKCHLKPKRCTDSYIFKDGACRVESNGSDEGKEGRDYDRYSGMNYQECRDECTKRDTCKAFEWSNDRCELWKERPRGYESKRGFECHMKDEDCS